MNLIKILLIIILFILLLPMNIIALDRCQNFIPDIRSAAIRYLGLEYPWWYNIGCAMAESNCRQDVVSFDGGIGLFQLTPSTGILAVIEKEFPVNPYNTESNIRAQAFYIRLIRDKYMTRGEFKFKSKYWISPINFTKKCGLRLSDIYRHYNGGYWFIYESKLANSSYDCDEVNMRQYCVRGGTFVGSKNPKWLSFCDVNYSYANKIYKFSQKYKIGNDGIGFWEKHTNIKR